MIRAASRTALCRVPNAAKPSFRETRHCPSGHSSRPARDDVRCDAFGRRTDPLRRVSASPLGVRFGDALRRKRQSRPARRLPELRPGRRGLAPCRFGDVRSASQGVRSYVTREVRFVTVLHAGSPAQLLRERGDVGSIRLLSEQRWGAPLRRLSRSSVAPLPGHLRLGPTRSGPSLRFLTANRSDFGRLDSTGWSSG